MNNQLNDITLEEQNCRQGNFREIKVSLNQSYSHIRQGYYNARSILLMNNNQSIQLRRLETQEMITRWDDNALAPKNMNILQQLQQNQIKPFTRKHILANKRRSNLKVNLQNIQNQPRETINHRHNIGSNDQTFRGQKDLSTLTKFKYKIRNLEKDFDRWEESNFKKMESIDRNGFYYRAKSGFIKAHTEEQEMLTYSLNRNRHNNRSIEHTNRRSRPNSCRHEIRHKIEAQGFMVGKMREKTTSIHSKARSKSYSISRKQQISKGRGLSGLTINQLDSRRALQMLRCLSICK